MLFTLLRAAADCFIEVLSIRVPLSADLSLSIGDFAIGFAGLYIIGRIISIGGNGDD